jgi:hypothetical protein
MADHGDEVKSSRHAIFGFELYIIQQNSLLCT